ncbi:hypothetical protein FRC12_021264 [Ceratobasidium sp. 428]|nr:hypothetical protein FRC12_021264 [Ceratobasidium sp. 428]
MLSPLAKIPMRFAVDPEVGIGESPYDIEPWTNKVFREICGLKPLREHWEAEDREDGEDGGSGENQTEQAGQYADVADGFVLSDKARKSIPPKDLKWFTSDSQLAVSKFMDKLQEHARQYRRGEFKPSNKRRRKDLPAGEHDPHTFIARAENIPGYENYKGAVLALLNLKGGVVDQVVQCMKDHNRMPLVAWQTAVYNPPTVRNRNTRKPSDEERERQIEDRKKSIGYKPPAIGDYLDDNLKADVAHALFGSEAFGDGTDIMLPCYRQAVTDFVHRTWERLSRQGKRTLQKCDTARDEFSKQLEAATTRSRSLAASADPRSCARLMRAASVALKTWKDLAEITGEVAELRFVEKEKALESLWHELVGDGSVFDEEGGAEDEVSAGTSSNSRRVKQPPFATNEQMRAAYEAYRELHSADHCSGVIEVTEALHAADRDLEKEDTMEVNLLEGCGDIGVDEFAGTSEEELLRLLGISLEIKKLPFLSESFSTRWHQLVGIAKMLKRMFTANLDEQPLPTLLCDDVGLGKTAQIVGTLCMLVHFIRLQDEGKPLPPLLTEASTPYFAGREKIPRLPIALVVPLTLVDQWRREIKKFTTEGAFRTLTYSDPVRFFEPGGLWDKVMKGHDAHRTIILVPLPTLVAEARRKLSKLEKGVDGREKAFRGATVDTPLPKPTILDKLFLLFAGDELHNCRNVNMQHVGVQQLASRALVRVGATATPLITGSNDIAALGRLLRLPTMIGDEGYTLGMAMLNSQRTKRSEQKRSDAGLSEIDAAELAAGRGDEPEITDAVLAERLANENVQRRRVFDIHREAIGMAKELLMPTIIRRTGRSLDYEGKRILDLDPYLESIVWSPQRPHELEAVQKLKDKLMQCKNDGDDKEMLINFLHDHKLTVFHWKLLGWKQNDERFWEQWTRDSLEEDASSKILTAISLVKHYQNPEAEPLFFKQDGTRDTTQECSDFCPAVAPRKVIMLSVLSSHRAMLKTALDLADIQSIEYDGSMTPKKRDQALAQFEQNKDIRVMLVSSVGTTGLNVTVASVGILLSGLWSRMDINQFIGRMWRPGQPEIVIIHHVFAPNTVDGVLAGLAGGKLLMLDYLYEAGNLARKVFDSSLDEGEDEAGNQDDQEMGHEVSVVKSRVRSRPLKRQTDAETEPSADRERPPKRTKTDDNREPSASGSGSGPTNTPALQGPSEELSRPEVQGQPDTNPLPSPQPAASSGISILDMRSLRESDDTSSPAPISYDQSEVSSNAPSSPVPSQFSPHLPELSLSRELSPEPPVLPVFAPPTDTNTRSSLVSSLPSMSSRSLSPPLWKPEDDSSSENRPPLSKGKDKMITDVPHTFSHSDDPDELITGRRLTRQVSTRSPASSQVRDQPKTSAKSPTNAIFSQGSSAPKRHIPASATTSGSFQRPSLSQSLTSSSTGNKGSIDRRLAPMPKQAPGQFRRLPTRTPNLSASRRATGRSMKLASPPPSTDCIPGAGFRPPLPRSNDSE